MAGGSGKRLVGNIIKFPDDGRLVRFGRADVAESATIIILPVVRIERYADSEPMFPPNLPRGGRWRTH